jgi:chitin deacetylase
MKKRYLLTAPLLFVVGFFGLWQLSRSRTFQLFGEIIPRVNTAQKVVALTFDDGPVPGSTEKILAELDAMKVRATFFVTGLELEQNRQEGQKIVEAGHELGNHSYSHKRMVFVTPSFVQQEVERTDRLIQEAGYKGEIYFRPPYGKKLVALPYYLAKTDRKTIMWDIEPDSYPEIAADSDKIAEYVSQRVQPGSIVILHVMYPNRKESLKAVKKIVARLREKGYGFKTVSELLATAQ